jgi:Type IV pili methyl-accepting chemotaxis transducer N-term
MFKTSNGRRPPMHLRAIFVTTALAALAPSQIAAQDQPVPTSEQLAQNVEDKGGTARINFSGKLRMLSQRIPASACALSAGVDPDGSKERLKSASEEFAKILIALQSGDESLGIKGAEDRKKNLVGLQKLSEEWAPMQAAVTEILGGGDPATALPVLYEKNGVVLGIAQKLVTEIAATYSDPNAMSQAAAIAVDIAGRQRMLSQKMAKLACMISTGSGTAELNAELAKTIEIYDATLIALIDGMPDAGIVAAPTPELRAALVAIRDVWQGLRPLLDGAAQGTALDAAALGSLVAETETMLAEMNKIVSQYSEVMKF